MENTEPMKSVEEKYGWHYITVDDLNEDSVLELENGLKLRYIGEVDIRTNNCHLFKTLYSPFATTIWMEMSAEKITTLKVKTLHSYTASREREMKEGMVKAVNTLLQTGGRLDGIALGEDGHIYAGFDGKSVQFSSTPSPNKDT